MHQRARSVLQARGVSLANPRERAGEVSVVTYRNEPVQRRDRQRSVAPRAVEGLPIGAPSGPKRVCYARKPQRARRELADLARIDVARCSEARPVYRFDILCAGWKAGAVLTVAEEDRRRVHIVSLRGVAPIGRLQAREGRL